MPMAQLFSLVSILAFVIVGTLVGWRIARLAKTTGREPERWIAICQLTICTIGYPSLLIARALPWHLPIVVTSIGIAGIDVGIAAIFYFTRCVFRPETGWLTRVLHAVIASLVVHWLGATFEMTRGVMIGAASSPSGGWTLFVAGVSTIGFGWTAWESLSYWAVLRRRVPLGLADPLVVNRVALWGMTGFSSFCINFVSARTALTGINVLDDAPTMIVTGVLGTINTVCLFLAFLPPAWYAARIRRAMPRPT
jgi:hypothetical protein